MRSLSGARNLPFRDQMKIRIELAASSFLLQAIGMAGRVLSLSAFVLPFAGLIVGCGRDHASDDHMILNFQKNAGLFDKLLKMSNENSNVVRIAYDFTRLETNWAWPRPDEQLGFSQSRWREYRKLFDKLHLECGLFRENSAKTAAVSFSASATGITFHGTSKGYVHSEQALSPLVGSLDREAVEPTISRAKHGSVFRKIADNWYLYYDW
jgi:hypothetical protein